MKEPRVIQGVPRISTANVRSRKPIPSMLGPNVRTSSLAQSLHLLNGADLRAKLAHPKGRAERLASDPRPAEAKVRELYRVAFAREPRPDELKAALAYLAEPRSNAAGQPVEASRALRENVQDLLWALMTTKEFLFNH